MRASTIAILACLAPLAVAGEWSGEIAAELRLFPEEPLDPVQHGNNLSVFAEPEYYHDWDDGAQRFAFTFFGRWDRGDDQRSYVDFRELYWRKSFDAAELYVGVRKVFWGVTESVHLVDIINQTDLVEDIDGEDKLGQPMINLSLLQSWGTLDFFLMPFFRERSFPGPPGRPRTALVVDTDNAVYESGDEDRHVDWSVRWSHFLGPIDIGLAHFYGTGRDPRLVPGLAPDFTPVLMPVYEIIDQTSLDLQATLGSWLWKLELISRRDALERFVAVAGGFEYTLVGLGSSDVDLGLVAEYIYDERQERATTGFYDTLALGARFAFNDVQSTELLVLHGANRDDNSRFISVEGSRRIGQSYRLTLEARVFTDVPPASPLASFEDDDYLELTFARFF